MHDICKTYIMGHECLCVGKSVGVESKGSNAVSVRVVIHSEYRIIWSFRGGQLQMPLKDM